MSSNNAADSGNDFKNTLNVAVFFGGLAKETEYVRTGDMLRFALDELKSVRDYFDAPIGNVAIRGNWEVRNAMQENVDGLTVDSSESMNWMWKMDDKNVLAAAESDSVEHLGCDAADTNEELRDAAGEFDWYAADQARIDAAKEKASELNVKHLVESYFDDTMTVDAVLLIHTGTDEDLDVIKTAGRGQADYYEQSLDETVRTFDVAVQHSPDGISPIDWNYFTADIKGLEELSEEQREALEASVDSDTLEELKAAE